jgi:hypothetical protein
MTSKILSALTALLAIVTALAALDLSGIAALIPGDHDALVAIISGTLATLGTILRAIGDLLDDGQVNGSYGRLRCHPLVFFAAGILALASLSSCAGLRLDAATPWGDLSSLDGQTALTLRPIVLPAK